ncbi:hypothetical protein [Luteolibacter soli]|uniref:Uncharacterized protein n=1 Tax=Luteolibacter soli TaxID=3135280 RepID=A0ABU9AZD3_9BACT
MKVALSLRLLLLVLSSSALAEELTTVDGKVYQNYRVTSLEADGLSILHDGGSAKVPYEGIPDELRLRYGYFKGCTLTANDGTVYRDYVVVKSNSDGLLVIHDGGMVQLAWTSLPESAKKHHGFGLTTMVTTDGKVYRNYVVTRKTPEGLTIRHDQGVTTISLDLIPAEVGLLYGSGKHQVLPTMDGKEYRNAEVVEATADGALVVHDQGKIKLAWGLLPEEIRTRYGYECRHLMTTEGIIYRNYSIVATTTRGLSIRHERGGVTVPFAELPPGLKALSNPDPDVDLLTLDGKLYRKYIITGRTSTGLAIQHEGGAAMILFKNLPEDLRDWQPGAKDGKGLAEEKDGMDPVIPPHDPEKDLVTLDGEVYHNYSVRKVEPDGLSILHDAGATKVDFERLSTEIQKRYNYDPFDAYDHDQAEAKLQREADMQHEAAVKEAHDEAAKAAAERKFTEAFARSASRVQIQPGLESFGVCNGTWGKTPASLQAAGVQDYVGGLACNMIQGRIGMVPVFSGKIKKGDRKAWVFDGIAVPSFVHLSPEELGNLSGTGDLVFSQPDGRITKLSYEHKVWRIGKVKMVGVTGAAAVFPNYTTSSSLAEKFYRKHGFPAKSSELVLEWSAVYQ